MLTTRELKSMRAVTTGRLWSSSFMKFPPIECTECTSLPHLSKNAIELAQYIKLDW